MAHFGSWTTGAMLLSLGTLVSVHPERHTPPPRARDVLVVATDYALSAPDTISAGMLTLRLENRGEKAHEVVLALVRDKADAAAIMAAAKANLGTPRLGEGYADGPPLGALFAAPHTSGRATLTARVRRGRDYVLICTLHDVPSAPQHAALGMFHVFHVR